MTMDDPSKDTTACPFCGMVRGEVAAHRVYADPTVFAILDRRPINAYHLLIIPTVHVADFYDLDDAVYTHLMRVARRLAGVVKVLASPKKVGLLIAGFDVPHTHVHVIPMHDYHDITSKRLLDNTLTRPSAAELAANAAQVREALRTGEWEREAATWMEGTDTAMPDINWDHQGLVPAIVQDRQSGQVLMLAYMNAEALALTLETGQAHYWSRSRQELWHKGATSGHFQHVKEIRYDCDADAILLMVDQVGAACHTGQRSCFYRSIPLWVQDAGEIAR